MHFKTQIAAICLAVVIASFLVESIPVDGPREMAPPSASKLTLTKRAPKPDDQPFGTFGDGFGFDGMDSFFGADSANADGQGDAGSPNAPGRQEDSFQENPSNVNQAPQAAPSANPDVKDSQYPTVTSNQKQPNSPPASYPPSAFAAQPGPIISGANSGYQGFDPMSPAQGSQFKRELTASIRDPHIKALALAAASKETANGRDGINHGLDAHKQNTDSQNYGPMRMNKKMLMELGYTQQQMEQMNDESAEGRGLCGEAFERGCQEFGQKNGQPDVSGFYAYHSGGWSQYQRWKQGTETDYDLNGPHGRVALQQAYEKIQRTFESDPELMTNDLRPYTGGDTWEH